jgi:hypothetical protein
MPNTPNTPNWSVLFLVSPSPGRVFRYLERACLDGSGKPLPDLISETTTPHGWRALTGINLPQERMEELGQRLSGAFMPYVILLWRSGDTWGYAIWEQGEEKERGGSNSETDASSPTRPLRPLSLLARLPGGQAPPAPPIAWAATRGLPLARVPGALPASREYTPVIEYVTVETLDQRGLLVENAPRLYRFDFAPQPPTPTSSPSTI